MLSQDLVFVDETGSHIALTSLYAYAPRGQRAVGKVPRNYGAIMTLIASMSMQGMGEALILDGAADAAAFEVYVEQLLAPGLRPGQIVILDNLRIHQGTRGKEAIEARGCRLVFLPAYSPNFSPIEEAFSKLKTLLRRVGARTRVCRSRLRQARQVAQTLHRHLRRKVEEKEAQQKELYQQLIQTAEQMVRQAQRVVAALGEQTGQQARRLVKEARHVLPLVERVITQTRTRVLEGKKMASDQKVLSLFEPHTRAIPRHKGGALVEFGRHVVLDEVEGGIVTRYQILSHPNEHGQAVESVAHHQQIFAHPPGLVAGDRGVHSVETEERLKAAGVKRVAIPAAGKLSQERQALERMRTWKRGYRWRAGIEGRIASLRRDYGWRRSAYHGQEGMERWLGLGVIASNLRRIAHAKVS